MDRVTVHTVYHTVNVLPAFFQKPLSPKPKNVAAVASRLTCVHFLYVSQHSLGIHMYACAHFVCRWGIWTTPGPDHATYVYGVRP